MHITCHMPSPSPSSLFGHPNNMWWGIQIIKLLVMQSSPLSCHLVPLMPKYLLQHPILEHIHPMFLPQWEKPSFIPIQNKQNYSSEYCDLYIFGHQTGRQESLLRIIAKIDTIYLLTAIGLSTGGSSTVHIYTQTIHRTTQITTELHK